MRLNEYPESSSISTDWVDMAERLGIDRAYAHDVVGAVLSYCRMRHGAAALDDDYLSFLVARTAYVARGDTLTADQVDHISERQSDKERMLMRALASSNDPSLLYDTYRMKLVSLQTSQVFSSGYVLSANLRKISAGPHENLSFLWLSLFKRVASCLADWRDGNPGITGLIARTGCEQREYPADVKDLFVNILRQVELKRELSPARLIWAK